MAPLQEGLLFHAQYDDQDTPDVYVIQVALQLEGPLNSTRLETAAQAVLNRHPHLTACFLTRPNGQPIQVIPTHYHLPWHEHDLTHLTPTEQQTQTENILNNTRTQRFTMTTPPLIRYTLIHHTPHHHTLALTLHHILLDGWSMPILIHELLTHYHHPTNPPLPQPTPYKHYLTWLNQQDHTTATTTWTNHLHNTTPTHLTQPHPPTTPTTHTPQHTTHHLTPHTTHQLTQHTRKHQLTLNTLIQGTWALLLNTHTGNNDITFGTTTTQRPPHIPTTNNTIGLYINTTPTRTHINPHHTITQHLTHHQHQQTQLLDHQHLSLTHIHNTTHHTQLFNTTTVFENYPL
ncbi:condensation domain-containing protein, partial [Streptomyces sp. NPDC048057]|uniref:condensation domain-containing protein n=1 Tax=Streptomyces sp. NPDC048057 TaxID=3155628 RepID=UPI0033FBA414